MAGGRPTHSFRPRRLGGWSTVLGEIAHYRRKHAICATCWPNDPTDCCSLTKCRTELAREGFAKFLELLFVPGCGNKEACFALTVADSSNSNCRPQSCLNTRTPDIQAWTSCEAAHHLQDQQTIESADKGITRRRS